MKAKRALSNVNDDWSAPHTIHPSDEDIITAGSSTTEYVFSRVKSFHNLREVHKESLDLTEATETSATHKGEFDINLHA